MDIANGDKVITNSMHLSGGEVPQQFPTRGTGGEETQVPLGFAERSTEKEGVLGSQLTWLYAEYRCSNTKMIEIKSVRKSDGIRF